jgi:predicted histidine transporter YuiF (NhaC family)
MTIVGLIVTMEIGSSFSIVPILASIYAPPCQVLGFSVPTTICTALVPAVTGNAPLPASDMMLGIISGISEAWLQEYIYDTTIPVFLHFDMAPVTCVVLGAMILRWRRLATIDMAATKMDR